MTVIEWEGIVAVAATKSPTLAPGAPSRLLYECQEKGKKRDVRKDLLMSYHHVLSKSRCGIQIDC